MPRKQKQRVVVLLKMKQMQLNYKLNNSKSYGEAKCKSNPGGVVEGLAIVFRLRRYPMMLLTFW